MEKSVLEFIRRKFLYFFVLGASLCLAFIALTASSKKQVLFLNENIEITSALSNMDLNGHSVFVQCGGIVLENLTNGEIIITETVGAGTVTFKNCHNINVVVQSKANILLDEKTSIQNLRIKDNARVSSIKTLEDKYRKKSFSLFKKRKIDTQPEILNTEIDSDLQPILEGGDFVSVTEKERTAASNDKNNNGAGSGVKTVGQNNGSFSITQDMSYEGNGVRLYIQNRPKNATELNVRKIHNGVDEDVDWISNHDKKDSSDRFFSEYYTYEFLNAGEQYVFRFDYFGNDKKVGSASVTVTPKFGQEVEINNDCSLFIDEATGDFYWKIPPKSNLPTGALIAYEIDSQEEYNWAFIGFLRTSANENKVRNIYRDFENLKVDSVLNEKIYMRVFYEYNGFRWTILETSKFKFDAAKILELQNS